MDTFLVINDDQRDYNVRIDTSRPYGGEKRTLENGSDITEYYINQYDATATVTYKNGKTEEYGYVASISDLELIDGMINLNHAYIKDFNSFELSAELLGIFAICTFFDGDFTLVDESFDVEPFNFSRAKFGYGDTSFNGTDFGYGDISFFSQ